MSPHHSDQMSGKSEVNWIVFCITNSKVLSQSVSQSVTRSPIELFWTAKNIVKPLGPMVAGLKNIVKPLGPMVDFKCFNQWQLQW